MREQNYVHRAIVSPVGIFKSPMEVVEANGIALVEKVAILKAWEADERAPSARGRRRHERRRACASSQSAGRPGASQKFRLSGEAGLFFFCAARVNLGMEPLCARADRANGQDNSTITMTVAIIKDTS